MQVWSGFSVNRFPYEKSEQLLLPVKRRRQARRPAGAGHVELERPCAGPRLPGVLHPSGGDLERAHPRLRARSGANSSTRQSLRRQTHAHAASHRVHRALPGSRLRRPPRSSSRCPARRGYNLSRLRSAGLRSRARSGREHEATRAEPNLVARVLWGRCAAGGFAGGPCLAPSIVDWRRKQAVQAGFGS